MTATETARVVTLLDAAHAAVSANPEDETARLRFYERLADGELFLLLAREAEGEVLDPRVFELEMGKVVLVFDREERLADFAGGIAPYAALPGRVIAGLMRGQGIGLGVNLGVAPSEMLLPAEAMDWLAEALEGGPEETEAAPREFTAPAVPEALVAGLDAKLAKAGGLARAAVLAGVVYSDGRRGHLLAFVDAAEGAAPALAGAVREALVFSGIEAGELDVGFLREADPARAAMERVGLRFDLPEVAVASPAGPAAPGMDADRPPKLR
ncbi:MAG: SseB family protein [Paracoccaceae bacterium]